VPSSIERRLYVIRHGDAVRAIPSGEDFPRPLTRVGREDVLRLGVLVAPRPPEHLWCSPARRTRETADGLLKATAAPAPKTVYDERIYAASAGALLSVLAETPATVATAALIGHNPGVTDLVRTLLGDLDAGLGPIVPGTLVALSTDRDWNALDSGVGRLVRYEPPR
jgi:phosphohistidine phosphatase